MKNIYQEHSIKAFKLKTFGGLFSLPSMSFHFGWCYTTKTLRNILISNKGENYRNQMKDGADFPMNVFTNFRKSYFLGEVWFICNIQL